MQKMREKLNANAVGTNCIQLHFEGMAKNKQKGITLIALIITIIVMLILVGVTINIALNRGLFQKAEIATKQTQIESEKEELLSAVVAAIGNDGKLGNIETPEGWDFLNGTYISPKGNKFTVDENGKISKAKEKLEGTYTFTLNQLVAEKDWTYLDNDYTGIIFDADYLWNSVIKEDLSNNKKYFLNFSEDYKTFAIESTDGTFIEQVKILLGIDTADLGSYLVYGEIYLDKPGQFNFVVGIYNPTNDEFGTDVLIVDSNPEEGQMTVEEFLQTYGDVEFKFVDVSSMEIPSEE